MAILYNKFARRTVLSLIIIWSVASFWIISPDLWTKVLVLVLGFCSLIFTYFEIVPIYLLIFLSFTTAYALYGFYYQYALPLWLVMLAILFSFGYLFLYNEQKIGILGNQRLVYLLLFSLVTLEMFLTLNFFLISPLSKSLIVAAISYLYVGFCYIILARHTVTKFSTYIIIFIIAVGAILISSVWGGAA